MSFLPVQKINNKRYYNNGQGSIHDIAQRHVAKVQGLKDWAYLSFISPSMQRINPDVDIVMDVLKAVLEVQPQSSFTQSLLRQYQERGGLSKKQLQGLYSKSQKISSIPPNKLATLEAIIKRKPNREKSDLPETVPLYQKDESNGKMIEDILKKYPQHKRVLFLQVKYENNEILTPPEITELKKFYKLLS